jgi:Tfp pilus assembly protein PilF
MEVAVTKSAGRKKIRARKWVSAWRAWFNPIFPPQTDCQKLFFPISIPPMKRLLPTVGAALLAIALVVKADAPDELYTNYYLMLQDAEALQIKGEESAALIRYRDVEDGLKKLQSAYPSYNTTVIKFRLDYVTKKITPLAAKYPDVKPIVKADTSSAAPTVTMPAPAKGKAAPAEPVYVDTEITRLHDQLISIQADKLVLQKQLKDALAAKPAAVDPKELAKAEAQVAALQKEKDVLQVSLKQEQARAAKLVEPKDLEENRKQLAEQKQLLAKLTEDKASLEKKISSMKESKELPQLRDENSALKKQVSELNKQAGSATKLQESNKSLEVQVSSLKAENSSLKDSVKKAGDVAKLDMANKSLEAEVKTLKSENGALKDASKKVGDLAKLETEVKALRSQNEALSSQLKEEQKKSAKAMAVTVPAPSKADEGVKRELVETQRKLAEQEKAQKQALETAEKLRKENAKLEALLTDPSVNTTKPTVATPAPVVTNTKEIAKLESKVRDLEAERASLEKKLKDAKNSKSDKSSDQVSALKAQLDVLKAEKAPYTKEELALFKAPSTPAVLVASVEAPTTGNTPKPGELSSESRALLADAQRAFNEKNYQVAADKYEKVLKAAPDNVYVLSNLAAIQMELDQYSKAESNLKKALEAKKDDAYSLSLMGILKFRQDKYDDALELLSRSAALDPNSADTQNFLGITLSQKGQRVPAEAALRKAIQLAPGNANAHHNLAVIYATQTPPMTELARWHYQKARSYGHPVNEKLEKMLAK